MKTKRSIYLSISSVLGLFLIGCSQADEPALNTNSQDYILFSSPSIDIDGSVGSFSGNGTRATLAESIDKFDVWGYCIPRSAEDATKQNQAAAPFDWSQKAKFFTAGPDIFNKIRVKAEGGYADYTASTTLKEWNSDEEARYTFIGTSVIEGAENAFSMAAANAAQIYGPRLTFTLPATGTSLTSPLDYTKQPDALVAYTFDHQKADGKVKMSFMHIMIGLRFMFHNYTDEDLVIKKVTFSGEFHKQVTIDFSTEKPDYVLANTSNSTYKGTFTLLNEAQTIGSLEAAYMGSENHPATLLLLPNRHPVLSPETGHDKELILGNSKTINITYQVGNNAEKTFPLNNFELNYIPQENSLHTAHFNFVGDKFVVMFQADNDTQWGNGSDTNIDIQ